MDIKNKIKGYRNMLGLNQKQMGEKLGITKQAYHNKEVGKNYFKDEEKIIFKNLLLPLFPNITLEDIFF
ncbi:transcriptional regulator [Granulicatella sp. zg-ZJ]|uniref:helix-turn-helix transcriptional regulator n=1 Tax=Granulicatella sp. zg-ZJ TaxID=2678504 RepID=UPI0013D1DAFF|nr:transcriptional regulator [Granulicatella sp. zg-ZJ]NEW62622.1 transcriptional regulator [Granulicatella sp. zg-ZJ]